MSQLSAPSISTQAPAILFGFHGAVKPLTNAAPLPAEKPDAERAQFSPAQVTARQRAMIPDMTRDAIDFLTPLTPGSLAKLQITAVTAGFVNAWFNFDGRSTFHQPHLITENLPVQKGFNSMLVAVPPTVAETIHCRFQFSSERWTNGCRPSGIWENVDTIDSHLGLLSNTVDASLVSPSGSLANLTATLLDGDGQAVLDFHGLPITTLTDAQGRYTFWGLPDGVYTVSVNASVRVDQSHQHRGVMAGPTTAAS